VPSSARGVGCAHRQVECRMTHRRSLDHIAKAAWIIDPALLATPQFVSDPLSEALGVRLIVKVAIRFRYRTVAVIHRRGHPMRPQPDAAAGCRVALDAGRIDRSNIGRATTSRNRPQPRYRRRPASIRSQLVP
jgi:hypothetical protein